MTAIRYASNRKLTQFRFDAYLQQRSAQFDIVLYSCQSHTTNNSSSSETLLNCAMFYRANMDLVDLSFAHHDFPTYYHPPRHDQRDFIIATLINATLYKVDFHFTDFSGANLSYANLYGFRCINCTFMYTLLFQADLSFS